MSLLDAILATVFNGGNPLVNRYALREGTDTLAYALAFHVLAALFYLPFFTFEFKLPAAPLPYALTGLSVLLWTALAIIGFESYKYIEASARATLARSKLLWAALLATVFLGEVLTGLAIVGILLVFAGAVVITYKPGWKLDLSDRGVRLTLLAAFLTALTYIVDKAASVSFAPSTYGFLIYLLPGVLIAVWMRNRRAKIRELFQTKGKWVVLVSLLGTLSYYYQLRAYQTLDASLVATFLELSVVVSVIGGIFLLKENKNIARKLLGAAAAITGAILVALH